MFSKEVSSYFNSLVGYLVIGLYLILTSLLIWLFPETSILESGYADLNLFFQVSPYLFIFLIPALTMRSIAGEISEGTFDLLRSRPVSIFNIVLGKFFAALTLTVFALLPSLVYVYSIYSLAYPVGNIDLAAIVGSYIGLLMLALSFCALGLFSSCLTKNPIVSFLLSAFLCFIFYDVFSALSKIPNLNEHSFFVANIGIKEHYESVSRGVLSFQDTIYFFSFTLFFLMLTIGHIDRKFRTRKKTLSTYVIVLTLLLIANGPIFTSLFDRIDFTSDNRYSLSETSKTLLKEIDQNIYVTLFLDGKLPSDFDRLKRATIELVKDFQTYSKGAIFLQVIDPFDNEINDSEELIKILIDRGLSPTNLNVRNETGVTQRLVFPGVIISTDQMEIPVNLLQDKAGISHQEVLNNTIQNLEYALMSGIQKVISEKIPILAFTEGNGEPTDLELYDAIHTLAINNQTGRVNLEEISLEDINKLDVLIIVKPTKAFSETVKYKINHFARHGGCIIWAIDQTDANLDKLKETGQQTISGQQLNLDDLLFMYGVRINYDLIADLNCAVIPITVGRVGTQAQVELMPWYFSPILTPNTQHPLTKNLDGIKTDFVSTIDTIPNNIKKEIILKSSPYNRALSTGQLVSLDIIDQNPDPEKFKSIPSITGVLMEGKFPNIFANRAKPEGIDSEVDLNTVSKSSKMLVVSDGDWLINQINNQDSSAYALGWDRYSNRQFANKIFLQNSIDYLLNDASLIALRNREHKLMLLDKAKVKTEKTKWKTINIVVPPLLLCLFGLVQYLWRKYKYARKTI